jgi:hypothetical protein
MNLQLFHVEHSLPSEEHQNDEYGHVFELVLRAWACAILPVRQALFHVERFVRGFEPRPAWVLNASLTLRVITVPRGTADLRRVAFSGAAMCIVMRWE